MVNCPFNMHESNFRQECASLLFRFHHTDWTHNSFFSRNILVRNIDDNSRNAHSRSPSDPDPLPPRKTFRLIDFGRALQYDPETGRPLRGPAYAYEDFWKVKAGEDDRAFQELKIGEGRFDGDGPSVSR